MKRLILLAALAEKEGPGPAFKAYAASTAASHSPEAHSVLR